MKKKAILLAMGHRHPALAKAIEDYFRDNDHEVLTCSADTEETITKAFEQYTAAAVEITTCIYFPEALFATSVFSNDFIDTMEDSISAGFVVGAWWIKGACEYYRQQKASGNLIILNHIPAIVPTQRYSYCCIAEAALTNLAKVAVMDTQGNTPVRINILTHGWLADEGRESAWLETLIAHHGAAKAPILQAVEYSEVAEAIAGMTMMKAMNGSNLILDQGFSISRSIVQIAD